MDKIGDAIGDRQKFNRIYDCRVYPGNFINKLFGFNPFTSESYEKCLWLAFLYPAFSFLIILIMTGHGQTGNLKWSLVFEISTLSFNWRFVLIGIPLVFAVYFFGFYEKYKNKKWLLITGINILMSFIVSFSFSLNLKYFFLVVFAVLIFQYLIFFLIFVNYILGGRLASLSLHSLSFKNLSFLMDDSFKIAATISFNTAYCVIIIIFMKKYSAINEALIGFVVMFTLLSVLINGFFSFLGWVIGLSIGGILLFDKLTSANVSQNTGLLEDIFKSWIPFLSIITLGGVVAGIVVVFLSRIKIWALKKDFDFWFWFLFNLFLWALTYVSALYLYGYQLNYSADENVASYILGLFLLFLPLLNAPLDWLSLGITRGVFQALRAGRHSGLLPLWLTIADLLIALIFLFLIVTILIGFIVSDGLLFDRELLSIQAVLDKIRNNPSSSDHWWIYFMLLSTLIPTLVHFALAGGAATLWLPYKWRLQLVDGLERDVHKFYGAWAYLTFMPVIGFVLVPGALLYFLWWLLNMHGGWLGMRLLDWAEMLAHFANPAMQ